MQGLMFIENNELTFPVQPKQEEKETCFLDKNNYGDELKSIKTEFSLSEDYNCLFCGGPRRSSRRCCSTECSNHLADYSSGRIPSVFIKTLYSLTLSERVTRLQTLANKQHVSFESIVKHFIKESEKLGKTSFEIIFTPKIAKYISFSGNLPPFIQ